MNWLRSLLSRIFRRNRHLPFPESPKSPPVQVTQVDTGQVILRDDEIVFMPGPMTDDERT